MYSQDGPRSRTMILEIRGQDGESQDGCVPGGTIVRYLNWAACAAMVGLSSASLLAGWPFSSNGPKRGSEEWYAMHAEDPVGDRQVYQYGKFWPPRPRPTGEKQLYMHRYHAAKYWPHPYVCSDREAVRSVWQAQTNNGWEMATTLYEYHFDPETNGLNQAGEKQVRWILQSAPTEHRRIYVQSMNDPAMNQTRVATVQSTIAGLAGTDAMPPVLTRVTHPAGRSAEEVNWIYEQELELRTPPAITYQSVQSGGGGGGGN